METIQTMARHDGPRGEVVLRRRLSPGLSVEELIINGAFAMDSSDSSTESLLGELALPSGRAGRVLVGGLGLGYTVAAILAKDVDLVDVVEIEQRLIDWAYQGVTTTLAAVASDPRVRMYAADVRLVLDGLGDGPIGPWDAIVLDVDNGPEFLIHAENRALYTEAGLRAAYAQLAVAGTLAIWCQGPAPSLREVLERIAPSVHEHSIEVARGERSFRYAIYTVSRPKDQLRPGSALRQESGTYLRRPGGA
jgi:spermidine synthase